MPRCAHAFVAATLAATLAGCGDGDAAAPPGPAGAPGSSVPPGIRLEERAEESGLRFRMTFLRPEQGETFKINLYDHASGLAVADYDGDGDDDVYLLNELGPNGLFRNDGKGNFTDVTAEAGVGLEDRISFAATFADADGDGDLDLYVTTARAGNVYFRNEGGGRFRDATKEAGLELIAHSVQAFFFDADGDGDLDLLVTNTAKWTEEAYHERLKYWRGKGTLTGLIQSEKEPDAFYRNDGKGRFTDATKEAGLQGKGWSGDVAILDMEGDGDLDVFVTNMFGSSTLYRNDGRGRFEDVTREALGRTSWGAVGTRAFDYDGDGLLDLAVVDMHSDMWIPFDMNPSLVEEKVKYPGFFTRAVQLRSVTPESEAQFNEMAKVKPEEVLFGNTLFRNKGGGAFEEVSERANWEVFWPWGIAAADYDLDGWTDVYIPSGMGHPLWYWRSSLLRNRGDGTFEDVCRTAGTEPPPGGQASEEVIGGRRSARSGRAAATGDFDSDGRPDLVVNNFNDRAFLWRNVSAPRRWCGLKLVETKGRRGAIGAIVKVTAGGRTQVQQVQAAGGYLAQSSDRLLFGLGDAAKVDRVEIRWPSGTVQALEDVKADAYTTVTEPAK